MGKEKKLTSIIIPCVTVFMSSACIMALELVAGRLIARHVGSSLYTWTSVIGVVLAGITFGNYLGGRIADKYDTRKALFWLFIISSVSCFLTVFISNAMGSWPLLWKFGFVFGVFSYVFTAFFIPSCLLGAISPVVAKIALNQGLPTGRTVGDIYACGAAGSILGTFVTGYFLISAIGTIQIIWVISGVLFAMGFIYSPRKWGVRASMIVFFLLLCSGFFLHRLPGYTGKALQDYIGEDYNLLFSDDTQYSYVSIEKIAGSENVYALKLNNYVHGVVHTQDPTSLQSNYIRISAAILKHLAGNKDRFSFLCLGGGAYVIPKYINSIWPASYVDIVEIDPALTNIAVSVLGLKMQPNMKIFHMDARNYVRSLRQDLSQNHQQRKYDFVYGDAFGDNSIPFQLVTKEFNEYLSDIMSDRGVYVVNVIDIYRFGKFLGAYINTLEETFPNVMVLSSQKREGNFIIVASKQEIDIYGIEQSELLNEIDLWVLNRFELDNLKSNMKDLIFTDNYAPVDNLIGPVAAIQARRSLANQTMRRAEKLRMDGMLEASIQLYKDGLGIYPPMTPEIYREIGNIYAKQGKWQEAVKANKKAIDSDDQFGPKLPRVELYLNSWAGLRKLGKFEESSSYLRKALKTYRSLPETRHGFYETTLQLGYALYKEKLFDELIQVVSKSIESEPLAYSTYELLAFALIKKNEKKEAIRVLRKASRLMSERGNYKNYKKIQELINSISGNGET